MEILVIFKPLCAKTTKLILVNAMIFTTNEIAKNLPLAKILYDTNDLCDTSLKLAHFTLRFYIGFTWASKSHGPGSGQHAIEMTHQSLIFFFTVAWVVFCAYAKCICKYICKFMQRKLTTSIPCMVIQSNICWTWLPQ